MLLARKMVNLSIGKICERNSYHLEMVSSGRVRVIALESKIKMIKQDQAIANAATDARDKTNEQIWEQLQTNNMFFFHRGSSFKVSSVFGSFIQRR